MTPKSNQSESITEDYINSLKDQIVDLKRDRDAWREMYLSKNRDEQIIPVDEETLEPIYGKTPWREKRYELESVIHEKAVKLRKAPAGGNQ